MNISIGLLVAFLPIIIAVGGLLGGAMVALYINHVIIPRLNHITELTNSTLTAAHKRIEELEAIVLALKASLERDGS